MKRRPSREVWICWKAPEQRPDAGTVILSFLSPGQEERFRSGSEAAFMSAREILSSVKDEALALYIDLVAGIGIQKDAGGRSLRQGLTTPEGASAWWFHPVSFKDCEQDETFRFIKDICVIRSVLEKYPGVPVMLRGAPREIEKTLRSKYDIRCVGGKPVYPYWRSMLGNFLERERLTCRQFWMVLCRMFFRKDVRRTGQVLFAGFWDWSFEKKPDGARLKDKYFGPVLELLEREGCGTQWLIWLDPRYCARGLKDFLARLKQVPDAVILQSFLSLKDIAAAYWNFKLYRVIRSFLRDPGSGKMFLRGGIDYRPLFEVLLLSGAVGPIPMHCDLTLRAAVRAGRACRPKALVHFLDFFPVSRALYTGLRHGHPAIKTYTVQHASICREKTFYMYDPEIEMRGNPDGRAMPRPEQFFCMGRLARDMMIENAYQEDDVHVTGVPRYDHLADFKIKPRRETDPLCLLLVTSVALEIERDMIEAVYEAAADLPSIRILLREHPLAPCRGQSWFTRYAGRIEVINGSLEEDLSTAGIVLFSYSTVAEEALIQGIPVWQWLPSGFNGSVFRDLEIVPRFHDVTALRTAVMDFQRDPAGYYPDRETIEEVIRQCFHRNDGGGGGRVADILKSQLTQ